MPKVEAGLIGLTRLSDFSDYVLVFRFSAANGVAWPCLQLVTFALQKIYGWDLVAEHVPNIDVYEKRIVSRSHSQWVNQDRSAALEAVFQNR